MPMHGIDISRWQKGIDLSSVPGDFVIVYVGPLNPYWEDQVKAAMRAGKRVLLYHYAHDGGVKRTASSEADQFLSLTRPYWALVDGTALDWESPWQSDVPWSLDWLNMVRTESRKVGWFYAYYHTLSDYDFGPVHKAGFPLWEAAYVLDRVVNGVTVPTRIDGYDPPDESLRWPVRYWGAPGMWQYTSTGFLEGWPAKLDLNVFPGDRAAWDRLHTYKEAAVKSYTWPLATEYETSQFFGEAPNNGNNPAGGHTGQDFKTPVGTPLYAPGDGVIDWAGEVDDTWEDNFLWLRGGRAIVVNCGADEPSFVMGHVSSETVTVGQSVKKGQLIGYTGNTGYSSGPHLHLEVLLPGFILNSPTLGRTDPRLVCSGLAVPLTVAPQGGTVTPIPPEEDMLTQEQADQLKFIYDALKNGGPDTPGGLSLLKMAGETYNGMFFGGDDTPDRKSLFALINDGHGSLASRLNGIADMVGHIPTTAPGGADVDLDALADKFVQRVTPTAARAFLAAVRNALPEEG